MRRREVEAGQPRRKLIVKRSLDSETRLRKLIVKRSLDSETGLMVRRNPDPLKDYVRRLIRVHETYEKAASMERRLDALEESGKSGTRAFAALERAWSETKDRAMKLHQQLGESPY